MKDDVRAGRRLRLGLFLLLVPWLLLGCGGGSTAQPEPTPTPGARFLMPTPGTRTPRVVRSPTAEIVTYTVREGDTLSGIAERYGVDLDDLIEANKDRVKDPNNLRVGQELRIPVTPVPASEATPTP